MKKTLWPLIALALLVTVPFGTKAQTGIENYVSASGYMIYHAPRIYAENAYIWDFEQDFEEGRILDWTLIDGDGDGHNWKLPLSDGMGHNGSDGMLVSYSYNNTTVTPLNPNNYMVSPRVTLPEEGACIGFWVSAMDEQYSAEHFGVAISTTVNNNPQAFTLLQDWTLTAKDQGTRQGNWYYINVDLSDYAGQEAYLAIRHFNVSDMFAICIDDVYIGSGDVVALTGCDIILDGQTVATNQNGSHYLLNTDGFVDGSNHNTTLKAHYQGGLTVENICDWTFRSGDHFQGSPTGLNAESDGSQVTLTWSLPEMTVPVPVDELYYDFADSTLSNLTLIDANHDGRNFRVYPYGGYDGGNCLKSDSWIAGGIGNVNPDNYVVLPQMTPTENGQISFMAVDCDMPGTVTDKEHFGVAVSTTGNTNPADFTMIAEWNSTGTYTEYSADLSAYAGQPIYVAIRHFNTTGEVYYLYVDNIRVTGIQANVTSQAKGALLFANNELIATLDYGETSFTHEVNRYTSEYCIRIIQDGSRENGTYYALAAPQCANAELTCMAPKNLKAESDGQRTVLTWERDIFTGFEEDPQGWTFLDADGDGNIFGIYNGGGMNSDGSVNTTNTNASLSSFSYINGYGALTPDNYAFMPKLRVFENASMTFYAAGYDPNYSIEHFGVAVASADGMNVATIAEWDSRNPYQAYTVDLSAYAGQEIFLGFRHFTTLANYALVIDNITVTNVAWAGTSSATYGYYVYRSTNGQNYQLIGVVTDGLMHFIDNDSASETYYYQVTAINTVAGGQSCESVPAMSVDGVHDFVVIHTDAIAENNDDISVYPNPANESLTIVAEGMSRIVLVNTLGQVVLNTAVSSDNTILNLSQFEAGLYLVQIYTDKGIVTKRVSVVR